MLQAINHCYEAFTGTVAFCHCETDVVTITVGLEIAPSVFEWKANIMSSGATRGSWCDRCRKCSFRCTVCSGNHVHQWFFSRALLQGISNRYSSLFAFYLGSKCNFYPLSISAVSLTGYFTFQVATLACIEFQICKKYHLCAQHLCGRSRRLPFLSNSRVLSTKADLVAFELKFLRV